MSQYAIQLNQFSVFFVGKQELIQSKFASVFSEKKTIWARFPPLPSARSPALSSTLLILTAVCYCFVCKVYMFYVD